MLKDKKILFSLIGAFLIAISPFFNWLSWSLSYDEVKEREAYNLFSLAGEKFDINIAILFGIGFIVIGLLLFLLEFFDYGISIRKRLTWIRFLEIIFVALLIIMIVSITEHNLIREYVTYKDGEIQALKYWIDGVKGYCNRGLGPVVAWSGVVICAAAKWGQAVYVLLSNIIFRIINRIRK